MKGDALDPGGAIAESFVIPDVSAQDCRVIFLDWAIKIDATSDLQQAVKALLDRHQSQPKDHPMRLILEAALQPPTHPARRGGRAGRQRAQ